MFHVLRRMATKQFACLSSLDTRLERTKYFICILASLVGDVCHLQVEYII